MATGSEPGGAAARSLVEFDSMSAEELFPAVSKRLGFNRVGPKICDRFASGINVLLQEKKLSMTDDNRVEVQPTP